MTHWPWPYLEQAASGRIPASRMGGRQQIKPRAHLHRLRVQTAVEKEHNENPFNPELPQGLEIKHPRGCSADFLSFSRFSSGTVLLSRQGVCRRLGSVGRQPEGRRSLCWCPRGAPLLQCHTLPVTNHTTGLFIISPFFFFRG